MHHGKHSPPPQHRVDPDDHRQEERPPAVRAAHRPADGDPRHHRGRTSSLPSLAGDLNLTGSSISWTISELLQLIFGSLLPLRRPRRRPTRTTPDVPDRPRHLHRILVRLCNSGHRRRPLRSSSRPGSRRSRTLSRRADDDHVPCPLHEYSGEGASPASEAMGAPGAAIDVLVVGETSSTRSSSRLADHLLRQPAVAAASRWPQLEIIAADTRKPRWQGLDAAQRHARNHESRRDRLRDHAGPKARVPNFGSTHVFASADLARPRCSFGRRSSAAPTHRCTDRASWPIALSATVLFLMLALQRARSSSRLLPAELRSTSRTCSGRGRLASPVRLHPARARGGVIEGAGARPVTSSADMASAGPLAGAFLVARRQESTLLAHVSEQQLLRDVLPECLVAGLGLRRGRSSPSRSPSSPAPAKRNRNDLLAATHTDTRSAAPSGSRSSPRSPPNGAVAGPRATSTIAQRVHRRPGSLAECRQPGSSRCPAQARHFVPKMLSNPSAMPSG